MNELTNVTKTHETPAKLNENRIKFWFQAMPLLFHSDKNIQNATVDAFNAIVPHLYVSKIDNHLDWPATKSLIIQT